MSSSGLLLLPGHLYTMTKPKVSTGNIVAISILLLLIVLIKLSTFFPNWIENQYSRGLYPLIANAYRTALGRIAFSVGDILYGLLALYLIIKLVQLIRFLFTTNKPNIAFTKWGITAFYIFAAVYIYFNLFWGLNYNRPGIAAQLQLNPHEHTEKDLKNITTLLLQQVNATRLSLGAGALTNKPYQSIFSEAKACYQNISGTFPYLEYKKFSVKPSMYGTLGNFLGFLGYYNPFTGEAQVNLTQPAFLTPFVTCHEIGHQLGYASESEANFVGFLAATSGDNLFRYSAYFDMYQYANHELYLRDSLAAKQNNIALDTLVKADVAILRQYWKKSDNVVEPFIRIFYDRYLKANQQSQGIDSYNEVIGWLIAYQKKYKGI